MEKGNGSGPDIVGAIMELANATNLLAASLLGGVEGKPIRDEVTRCAARAVELAKGESTATEKVMRRR
jgi:hypothetical protein